ncbi:V-type proton ATPase subunit G [Fasciola gigantica]|uniref:V-type proton ATPase subunit G n=1 Tax=Fasciola gigantica TaxID=46835 RepID=A0A504YP45_FASGI|nr:V-type proton ATPase subunit G [Fasciola gigantica]
MMHWQKLMRLEQVRAPTFCYCLQGRAKRLKAAKDEARAEMDQYKVAQDEHYRNLEEQVRSQQGYSEDSTKKYTTEQLERITLSYSKNKEAALNLLLSTILTVKPSVHVNFSACH